MKNRLKHNDSVFPFYRLWLFLLLLLLPLPAEALHDSLPAPPQADSVKNIVYYRTVLQSFSITGNIVETEPNGVYQVMKGKLSGLEVIWDDGAPASRADIRLRGYHSILQSSAPVSFLNGFPVFDFYDFSASDVSAIEITKGAAANRYSATSTAGAVMFTSRKGGERPLSVELNSAIGCSVLAGKPQMLSAEDYLQWQYELAMLRYGNAQTYSRYFGEYGRREYIAAVTPEWFERLYGNTGFVENHNIALSQNFERMKYRINLARTANRSIMQMNETGRINLSGFGEIKVTEQMGLQLNLTGAFPESKGNGATDPQAGFRSNFDSRTKLALLYPPVLLLQTAEEGFYYNMVNPVTALYDNDRVESRMNIFLSLQLNYRLSPHWLFTSGLSANGIDESLQNFYGSTSYYSTHLASDELRLQPAIKYSNEAKSLLFQKNELQYSFQNRNHNLRFSASQDITRSVYSYRAYIARGLPSRINFREQNSHLLPLSIAGNDSLHGIQNSFCWTASLEYQLLNRYKLTAFVRSVYTNSYLLSPRWQYLPYIELAWDADREKRLNYRLRRFSQIRFFVNAGYTADDRLQPSLFKLSDVPLDRSPMIDTGSIFEKTAKASAGADFTTRNGFMNGRIDFYYTSCNNLLLNNGGTICNMAAMETAGGDATIRFNLLQKSKCGLFAELNFSSSRNTVTSIGELKMYSGSSDWNSDIKDDFILLAGGSIGDIFGYVADGRYEVTDFLSYSATDNTWQLLPYVADASGLLGYAVRPGSMKLKDLNGDGRIDLNDRTILGNTLPKYTGGLSLWGYCGKVDFYLLFNGSYGNTIYNATKLEYTVSDKYDYRNLGAEMAQGMRWTYLLSDGSLCTEPAQLAILNSGTSMWSPIQQKAILSSYGVEDGSFLRLSQVNIGWNLPDKLLSRLMMQSGKVYISAYNLFTLSAYSGYMNEVSTRNSSRTLPTPGVDYSAFPACRTFMAGVSVKF